MRAGKGSDQRGAWRRMGWVIWKKCIARTLVIWGRGNGISGDLKVGYAWATVLSLQPQEGSDPMPATG